MLVITQQVEDKVCAKHKRSEEPNSSEGPEAKEDKDGAKDDDRSHNKGFHWTIACVREDEEEERSGIEKGLIRIDLVGCLKIDERQKEKCMAKINYVPGIGISSIRKGPNRGFVSRRHSLIRL